MADTPNVKWEVISKSEGDCWLSPYVPARGKNSNYLGVEEVTDALVAVVAGNSGVTVATGFDIGQKSTHQLSQMGVPADIRAKIDRYCAKTKRKALVELHKAIGESDDPYSIDLTDSQAQILDLLNKRYMVSTIGRTYDQCLSKLPPLPGRPARRKFADLDESVRTAIVCFAFQHGEHLDKYEGLGNPWRTFARLILDQRWLDVGDYLKTLKNDKLRRQIEASEFFDYCLRDSQSAAPESIEGRSLKSLRRHDDAAKNWKGPGRPPTW